MKYYRIGQKFTHDGVDLIVKASEYCEGCYFDKDTLTCTNENIPLCGKNCREDEASVIFKKTKK